MESTLLANLKFQLEILRNFNDAVVTHVCELVWGYLSKSVSGNIYNAAAQKFEISRAALDDLIEGIGCLFFQIFRNQLTEDQFSENAVPLGLEVGTLKAIYRGYAKHHASLEEVFRGCSVGCAQFQGLQWRLESDLASRSRRGGLEPRVLIKLNLTRGGGPVSIALTSDIPNIIRWNEMVEQALGESRTQNARRVHRAVS